MALTEKQIAALFKFTEENGVEYYDLQVELVDHLASAIEEEVDKNEALTPHESLNQVFASFGKDGFTPIIRDRRQAVKEGNRKLWWKTLRSCFTPPKIIMTLVVALAAFIISPYLSGVAQGYFFQAVVLGFPLLQLIIALVKNISANKRLLLLEQNSNILISSFTLAFILSPAPSNILVENRYLNKIDNLFFAAWFTMLFVIEYASFETNRKIFQKAQQLYPEAFAKA